MKLKRLKLSTRYMSVFTHILVFSIFLWGLGPWTELEAGNDMAIEVIPSKVLVEIGKGTLNLNFDFRIQNPTDKKLTIVKIKLDVYDKKDRLVLTKYISKNGLPSAMVTLGGSDLEPKATLYIFNPFYHFDEAVELHRLEYSFIIGQPGNWRMYQPKVTVHPVIYRDKTPLSLPLKERLLIEDGHDFYSHHRRLSLEHPVVKKLGIKSNAGRYAVDFCVADEKGRLFPGEGKKMVEWYGWNAPVYAPGSGKVVKVVGDFPDNIDDNGKYEQSKQVSLDNPLSFFGNFVIIDHGNGEFSELCHFKKDTIAVRPGQYVKTGDFLGNMGVSGSTSFPHIHYQLQDSPELDAEGLPAYFRNYRRWLGSRSLVVDRGALDSGDFVEHLPQK